MKKCRSVSCLEVVRENDAYVIYCFIECGYHINYLKRFLLFLRKHPVLERKIAGC